MNQMEFSENSGIVINDFTIVLAMLLALTGSISWVNSRNLANKLPKIFGTHQYQKVSWKLVIFGESVLYFGSCNKHF